MVRFPCLAGLEIGPDGFRMQHPLVADPHRAGRFRFIAGVRHECGEFPVGDFKPSDGEGSGDADLVRGTVRAAFLAALRAHDEVPGRHLDHHGTHVAVLKDSRIIRLRGLRRKRGQPQQNYRRRG